RSRSGRSPRPTCLLRHRLLEHRVRAAIRIVGALCGGGRIRGGLLGGGFGGRSAALRVTELVDAPFERRDAGPELLDISARRAPRREQQSTSAYASHPSRSHFFSFNWYEDARHRMPRTRATSWCTIPARAPARDGEKCHIGGSVHGIPGECEGVRPQGYTDRWHACC